MIIGVTGVFGAGKTTIARIFAQHGYLHINTDILGHKVLQQQKAKVVKEFGRGILTRGRIDRHKLKQIVFFKKGKLQKLNHIIHPYIKSQVKAISMKRKEAVVDGALLIEADFLQLIDLLVVVKITRKERGRRLLRKYSKDIIKKITESQLPQKEKLKYADAVIDNSKNLLHTKKQVLELINENRNIPRKL